MFTSSQDLYNIFLKNPCISTDSRNIEKGSIFFGLSGPNFNGNTFAEKALESGASYAVIDQADFYLDERFILVRDSLKMLQELANYHRKKMSARVIAITGSNGKTTTKELVSRVLGSHFKTFATIGNLNNQIGVPLSLLCLNEETEMAVIEMGASKPGDIKELCEIAEPDFGLITNIGKAHLEGMGGYEGVIKTKTELYDFLRSKDCKVFVNTNHSVFLERAQGMDIISFGDRPDNFVSGKFISSNPFVYFKWSRGGSEIDWSEYPEIKTQLMGYYNYENILAAVTIGVYFNVPYESINSMISGYVPENNRSQIYRTNNNTMILDAYNANPTSMEAAIINFRDYPAKNKMVILGKMMELGSVSDSEHLRIANLAADSSFDQVFLVGDLYREVPQGALQFSNVHELSNWFIQHPIKDKTILVKGSRANQLELLKEILE